MSPRISIKFISVCGLSIVSCKPSEPEELPGEKAWLEERKIYEAYKPIFGSVKDIDGNVYKTVTIGKQEWLAENLRTTKFSDGTPVPKVNDTKKWPTLNTPGYCDPNYDTAQSRKYGRLYNWFTVMDEKNLCPTGWHVPVKKDWEILFKEAGGTGRAGYELKAMDTTYWDKKSDATDHFGFHLLSVPYKFGGELKESSDSTIDESARKGFIYSRLTSYLWMATEEDSLEGWLASFSIHFEVQVWGYNKKEGLSVRCVKD